MATLSPVMAPIPVAGQISGSGIIRDLLNRIEAKLVSNCDLRSIDAYSGYSAEVQIRLQLRDVDMIDVFAPVDIGTLDPQAPVISITLGGDIVAGGLTNLEKPIEPVPVRIEQPVAAAPEPVYREAPHESVEPQQQVQAQVQPQPQQRSYEAPRSTDGKFLRRAGK